MSTKAITIKQFRIRFLTLLKHPFFWVLTVLGNSIILIGSLLIYFFERNSQKNPLEFIDSLLWAAGLVTTIGYADYSPYTFQGKIVVLVLMMSGTLFIWSYMVFLITGLISPELSSIERDVHDVDKRLQNLKEEKKI